MSQVSGDTCTLGEVVFYLMSQRMVVAIRDERLSWPTGNLRVISCLAFGGNSSDSWKGVLQYCILFIDPCHPKGCDSKSKTVDASLRGVQSKSGRMRPGGFGSTQLIQKLAQLA